MALLRHLFLHCAATPPDMEVTAEDIRRWHTLPKSKGGRGWSRVGYSELLQRSGKLIQLVEYNQDKWVEDNEITWGARGFNYNSRHICIAGGKNMRGENIDGSFNDVLTAGQFTTLYDYIIDTLRYHPDILIVGHRQVNPNKVCPGYDVPTFLRLIG